ncbi:prolyl oligopeptidase family serine peptidase [uncultured Prevotella sp.]|uniref:prolyl oligopeptidase family serine peptidase n=1 Tax=uncultured Prevotella sp. TaxID=159272 RepID=UPI00262C4C72|nr:prolyl oligopeptidase family serine peptidase [uncultured Prevotella sp.]
MNRKLILSIAATAMLSSIDAVAQVTYPKAPKDNTVDVYFGEKVADPYRWLEDDMSAQTAEWVDAENAVTRKYLDNIPMRKNILKRLKETANYEKIGIPFKRQGKWYVYRNNGLQNQSVLYQMDSPTADTSKQRVWLDPNALSTDGTVALKGIYFSHNGRYMAYVISRSGSDWEEIYVKDCQTGRDIDDHIVWAKFTGATWLGDGFYYSAYDAPEKGRETSAKNSVQKIYYHKIGTPQSEDQLFFMNPTQPLRFYNVDIDHDEKVMTLNEGGMDNGNNLYVRDLTKPNSQFIQMCSDTRFRYSTVETVGKKMYILTNAGAPKYRLMVADVDRPGYNDWKEVVPEGESVLTDVTFADDRMILQYSKDNCNQMYTYTTDGKLIGEIKLPTFGSTSASGMRGQKEVFYSFTSYTMPNTIYSYDLNTDKSTVWAAPKVNFRSDDYKTDMVFYTSKDGTRAPLFITYKKGMKLNGRNPLLLYGYGGFNITYAPFFVSNYIPFLERGGIYVHAVLRGGGEYGEDWHVAGTKLQKQNVFDDFIAAAEYLINNKYTSSDRLAIQGGSNGGLLVGACMTQRPDLYQVCLPAVGVMDMLRYHKFTIGWNWAPDYGTSDDSKEMFEYLRAYSPLHTLKPGVKYPATLVSTADHDDRVVPAHSFKFAARLQECQAGTAPTLISIGKDAGHGGGKPLAKRLAEQADILSFTLWNMGIKK